VRDDRKFVTQEAEAIGREAFSEDVGKLVDGGEVAEYTPSKAQGKSSTTLLKE
jgi:hypothetical protein